MKFIKKAAALLLAFLMLLVPATVLADETNVTDTTTAESFVCYGDDLNSEQFEKVMNLLGADLSKDQLIKVTIDDEKALLGALGYELQDVKNGGVPGMGERAAAYGLEKLSGELGLGLPTLKDMLAELQKPGRDPREDLPKPVLRTDVLDIKDLQPGMELTGTVRNVIDFGAFVDIGVHQDGLVHISRMADKFIRHPSELVKVGDVVKVWVVDVDEKKKRIALTMVKDRK